MDDVHVLCGQREWGEVHRRLRVCPRLALGTVVLPDGETTTTILHQAIADLESSVGAFCVVDFILSRRDLAREAASRPDGFGRLPLHVLAEPRTTRAGRAVRVLEDLVAAYKPALFHATVEEGWTPLHVASTFGWDMRFYGKLVALNPIACYMKDANGYLPAHLVCKHSKCLDKVMTLLQVHPAAIQDVTSDMATMLSLAHSSDAGPTNPHLIDFLVKESLNSQSYVYDPRSIRPSAPSDQSDPNGTNHPSFSNGGGGSVAADAGGSRSRRPCLLADDPNEASIRTTLLQPFETCRRSVEDDWMIPDAPVSQPPLELLHEFDDQHMQSGVLRQQEVSPSKTIDPTHVEWDGHLEGQGNSSVIAVSENHHPEVHNGGVGGWTWTFDNSTVGAVTGSRRPFVEVTHEANAPGVSSSSKKTRLSSDLELGDATSIGNVTGREHGNGGPPGDDVKSPPKSPAVEESQRGAIFKVACRGQLCDSPISTSTPPAIAAGRLGHVHGPPEPVGSKASPVQILVISPVRLPSRDPLSIFTEASAFVRCRTFASRDWSKRNLTASFQSSLESPWDPSVPYQARRRAFDDSTFDGTENGEETLLFQSGVTQHRRKKFGIVRGMAVLVSVLSLAGAAAWRWSPPIKSLGESKVHTCAVPEPTPELSLHDDATMLSIPPPTEPHAEVGSTWILSAGGCNETHSVYHVTVAVSTASSTEMYVAFGLCPQSFPRESPVEEEDAVVEAYPSTAVDPHDEEDDDDSNQPAESYYASYVWDQIKSGCTSFLRNPS